MEESEKKDVVPVEVDEINVHDLLARSTGPGPPPEDLKPNGEVTWPVLSKVKSKDDKKMAECCGMDSKPGTSQECFFCALCRTNIPDSVEHLVIRPDHNAVFKHSVRQNLVKNYSAFTVEEVFWSEEIISICQRHMEEEEEQNSASDFYCALCRQTVSGTVPNIVVATEPASRDPIREQLLKKYSQWKVDGTLTDTESLLICLHHVEIEGESERTICVFCANRQILTKYTTVIPNTLDEQKGFLQRIIDAACYPKRLAKLFEIAQSRDKDAEPLRMCNDHVKARELTKKELVVKPRRKKKKYPRKIGTPEQEEAYREKRRIYNERRKAEMRENEAMREARRLYDQKKWERIKSDPEKLAERNRRLDAYRKRHPRQPETAEQRALRRERDRIRRERMKREREERMEQRDRVKREREGEEEQTDKGEKTECEETREQTEKGRQRKPRKTKKKSIGSEARESEEEESPAKRKNAERLRERSPSKRTRKMTAKARECSEGMW